VSQAPTPRSDPAARPAALAVDPAPAADRLEAIDLARGLAILQMIAYHLCYDLNHFGWFHFDMLVDPRWIAWRSAIVTQFLLLVGVSISVRAATRPQGHRPNLRRLAQVAGCAALVSLASAGLFGARWIWFGVLHFVTLAQALLPPLAGRSGRNALLGAAALALGLGLHLAPFASHWLSWIGFSPVKPATEDFVPLLPWLGVVLLGLAGADRFLAPRGSGARAPRWLRWRGGAAGALPRLLGRWPLTTYMLHQPLLFGLLTLAGPR
jgi:uncharacterized membrane protein